MDTDVRRPLPVVVPEESLSPCGVLHGDRRREEKERRHRGTVGVREELLVSSKMDGARGARTTVYDGPVVGRRGRQQRTEKGTVKDRTSV